VTPATPPPKSAFRRYSRKALIAICGVCTLVVIALQILSVRWRYFSPLRDIELSAGDLLARIGTKAPVNPELVFVAIDQASTRPSHIENSEIEATPALKLMAGGYPWPRSVYPLILDRLFDAGAKVVLMDIIFQNERDQDTGFRAALDKYRDRVIIGTNFVNGSVENPVAMHVMPAQSLIKVTKPADDRVAFVNFWPDLDGTVRTARYGVRASDAFGDLPVADEEIFDSLAAKSLKKSGHGGVVPRPLEPHRIRFAGPGGTFAPRSLCDIFDAKQWTLPRYENGAFFRGKIVIIGPLGDVFHDVQQTPFGAMAGPELHLNAINAALGRAFLHETSPAVVYLLIAAAGVLAWVLCQWFHGPLARLASLVAANAAWLATTYLLYNHANLIIPMVAPLIALTLSGVGCLGWDFFLERNERNRVRSTLDKYVSKNVADLVLAESDEFAGAVKGQRRIVTVLFSDIRGFTAMTEEAVPEEFIAQLNEYFYEMVEAVLAGGGTLQNFIGDAVLAAWGDTRKLDPATGAYEAVRTALRMSDALKKLNKQWATQPGRRPLAIGIGIKQGEAILGSVGHPQRMNFTALGDTVNTAARLEGATKHLKTEMLVEETIEELTRDRFHFRRVDSLKLKGKSKATAVFTVLGEKPAPAPVWLAEYHRAVDLYHARMFREAAEVFRKLGEELKDDPLCAMYATRCDLYAETPPSADWDGAFTMTEK
jgi:adenylate cyclase